MSEDKAADGQVEPGKTPIKLTAAQLEALTHSIIEDTLYNAIHDIALSCHRSEKQLRMQSAATQAESLALSNMEPPTQKGASAQTAPPTATTNAAVYENGRVYLKGNPFKTTPDITCPHCKLPRLKHPISGKGAQNPDLTKEYCLLYPWVQRPGHDVYGNPFPTDAPKTKKERELMKQQQKAEKDNVSTPGSQTTEMADAEGAPTKEIKLNTGGKPASYIPWHTCPNCKRSLLITRFAQHLEKCLGINSRQSSRNAMAKLAGQNGSGSGMGNTPLGSRMGTPTPGMQGGGKEKEKRLSPVKKLGQDDNDELGDDNETPEKKKKKKSSYIKKADRERMAKEGILPPGPLKVKLKTKDLNKENELSRKNSEGGEKGEKRDRDREDGDDVPRKKMKLTLGKDGDSSSRDAGNFDAGGNSGGDGKGDSK